MKSSPPNPMKFDGDVLQVIANLEQLRRLYRSAYELGYARERRQWEKTTGTRDAGGPTAVVAAEQETIREKLRTVADLVTGGNGAKGASGEP
jgi:hypothetical protein